MLGSCKGEKGRTFDIWRNAGGNLVALLKGALGHPIANEAHLGGAVNLVEDQPGIIAAQVVLHLVCQLEPIKDKPSPQE